MSGAARLGAAAVFLAAAAARAAPPAGPVIQEVRVVGLDAEQSRELQKALPVRRGRPLEAGQADLAREVALSYMRDHGYLDAKASARVSASTAAATVTVELEPGPMYRFGKTTFEGLSRLSARAMSHELPYDPGDPYRRTDLLRAQSRLYGLGLFEDIDITASTSAARTADVLVKVRERPLKNVKVGVGWGSVERERVSLALTHNNLFGRAYTGEASVLYSHLWLEYRGEFVNRHFWGTDAEQRTGVSWRRENWPGYDLERTLGTFLLSSALPMHWRVTTAYKISQTVLYHVDPVIAQSEPDQRPLQSGLSLGLDFDTTDDPFFPTRGVRAGVQTERQGGVLGGDVDLNRGSARAAAYWSPFRQVVGAASFSGGVVRQYGDSPNVPIFERWFMGGATTVRGYREREVGPKDNLGSPIGGNVFTRGSVEARFPIYKRLGGAAFLDGGMVDRDQQLVWPARWRWGAGPGLRLKTPVGPVRLDAGWKINPDPGLARWVIHFSLGEAF